MTVHIVKSEIEGVSLGQAHSSDRPNAAWRPAIRFVRDAVAVSIFLFSSLLASSAYAQDDQLQILTEGTWGLSIASDPFLKRFPATIYVPPGTIIFGSRPGLVDGYLIVRLHYGHEVQIAVASNLRSLDNLIDPPPSKTIILHRSILCLKQTNRIATPSGQCEQQATEPVGKGWVYNYQQSERKGWVDVSIQLDAQTMDSLNLNTDDTNFDMLMGDLQRLEKVGSLTLLERKHPVSKFDYDLDNTIYVRCGQGEISETVFGTGVDVNVGANVGSEFSWFRFVSTRLGLSIQGSAGSTMAERSWTISLDTSERSFLYYPAVMVTDTVQREITVEKVFSCDSGPRIGPGDRIESVKFEVMGRPGIDPEVFHFEEASKYLPVPEELYRYHSRPIFVSANSPEQYERALSRVVEEHSVDIHLAHFMLANINYSCAQTQRVDCADLVDDPDLPPE